MSVERRGRTLIRQDPQPHTPAWFTRNQRPTPEPIPGGLLNAQRCWRCQCSWQLETGLPNPVNEWCRYDGDCGDHREGFVLAYLNELDAIDSEAKEWARLRAAGLSEGELAARSGTG